MKQQDMKAFKMQNMQQVRMRNNQRIKYYIRKVDISESKDYINKVKSKVLQQNEYKVLKLEKKCYIIQNS